MKIHMYGASDQGRKRTNNEDYFFYDSQKNVAIVADGVGGQNSGEVASKIAVEVSSNFILDSFSEESYEKKLREALEAAHSEILKKANTKNLYKGMATTINCLVFGKKDLFLAHVGDSRTYLIEDKIMTQLTVDQTLEQEIKRRNLDPSLLALDIPKQSLVSALGSDKLKIEVYKKPLKPKQIYLSASDGLFDMVSQDDMLSIILESNSLENKISSLIEKANLNGGLDNITAIICEVLVD